MKRLGLVVVAILLAVGLAGCAGMEKESRQRQVASMLAYLFPGAAEPPTQPDAVAVINVPFRIGVAFVPDIASPEFRLSEADRLRLAGQVRDAFAKYPFIREIEAVPSLYLEPGGGFANIDRIAALLRLDAIALVSYDQVQHADATALVTAVLDRDRRLHRPGRPLRRADGGRDRRVRHQEPAPADARGRHLERERHRHAGRVFRASRERRG